MTLQTSTFGDGNCVLDDEAGNGYSQVKGQKYEMSCELKVTIVYLTNQDCM
jgi:hypothetical protein